MLHRMLALMLVMAFSFPSVSIAVASRLSISPSEYDFGEVQFGKETSATFQVRNAGAEAVTIRRVRTSCGCTTANVSTTEIRPKESADLTVKFDSSGLKAGKTTKTVLVESNEPGNPIAKLRIFATVIKEIVVEPPNLVTRINGSTPQVEFPLTVRNNWNSPVTLSLANIQGTLKKAILTPQQVTISPGSASRFAVRMELEGNPKAKFFNGRLILGTNHPGEKWIGLPYFIKVDEAK